MILKILRFVKKLILYKMLELFNRFCEDLKLPPGTRENLVKPRDNEEMKVYLKNLTTLLYPDTYKLAGRLLIFTNIKNIPKKIESYVSILRGLLRDEICDFMLEHKEKIDTVLFDTYYSNFLNHDILSASSNINYLLKVSADEPPVETPCQLMMRQAAQFYFEEGIDKVLKCYYELLNQYYVHASPTMFNSGVNKNQLSSCFLLHLGDNLESLLYSGAGDVGLISKLQGGIGLSLSAIRHSNVSNTGKSSGVLPFGQIYDATIKCVNQGGKRNGAMTITLNDWHVDFIDFIQTRDNYTHNGIRFKQANICAFVSKLFMDRVAKKENWTFFCPAKVKDLVGLSGPEFEEKYLEYESLAVSSRVAFDVLEAEIKELETIMNTGDYNEADSIKYYQKTVERVKLRKKLIDFKVERADKVYSIICNMQIRSSMPYICYRDAMNLKNNTSNIAPTMSSNLCLEITLPANEDMISSCNLGHLNLKKYARFTRDVLVTAENITEFYDFEGLAKMTRALVRNINKVIDYNYYPLDKRDKAGNVTERGKISQPNFDNRPLGIGVSGLAEAFAYLNLPYDSDLAFYLNKLIFGCMYFNAMVESKEMAEVYGPYKNFKTGTSRVFVDGGWKTVPGSKLSNGYFQFDLWRQETEYLKSIDRFNPAINNEDDNQPLDPSLWGQEATWEELREEVLKHGVYNSMLIALMPTASSAQLLRNAETTEAHQTLIYSRKLVHGNYTAYSEPFVWDMQRLGLWNKHTIDFIEMDNGSFQNFHIFWKENQKFFPGCKATYDDIRWMQKIHKGMYEISQKVTMQMARQRGIYVCQSQSFNVWIGEPNMTKMKAIHSYGNALNLKTGMYYLRANPASQTNRFTVSLDMQEYYKDMKARKKAIREKRVICNEDVCIMCE